MLDTESEEHRRLSLLLTYQKNYRKHCQIKKIGCERRYLEVKAKGSEYNHNKLKNVGMLFTYERQLLQQTAKERDYKMNQSVNFRSIQAQIKSRLFAI